MTTRRRPRPRILFVWPFVFDTAFTLARRIRRREKVFTAHRSHLYQLLNRLGYSHRTVALLHYAAAIALGCLAVWMTRIEGSRRVVVFVPVILVHVAYSVWVMRQAHRHGLLDASAPQEAEPAA